MKCVKCIEDKVTGECYEIKDETARTTIENVKNDLDAKIVKAGEDSATAVTGINTSLTAKINEVNTSLDGKITTLSNRVTEVNTSLDGKITKVAGDVTALSERFDKQEYPLYRNKVTIDITTTSAEGNTVMYKIYSTFYTKNKISFTNDQTSSATVKRLTALYNLFSKTQIVSNMSGYDCYIVNVGYKNLEVGYMYIDETLNCLTVSPYTDKNIKIALTSDKVTYTTWTSHLVDNLELV